MTSVSVNINFGARMSLFYEKNWNFSRNVDFFIRCALLLKVIIFLHNMFIFLEKGDFMCEGLYTLTKCQILIKKFSFLVYVALFVLIFIYWKNAILIQNILFFNDTLGKCHFRSKIYIRLGINSCEKLKNFLRKVLI